MFLDVLGVPWFQSGVWRRQHDGSRGGKLNGWSANLAPAKLCSVLDLENIEISLGKSVPLLKK